MAGAFPQDHPWPFLSTRIKCSAPPVQNLKKWANRAGLPKNVSIFFTIASFLQSIMKASPETMRFWYRFQTKSSLKMSLNHIRSLLQRFSEVPDQLGLAILSAIPGNPLLWTFLMYNFNLGIAKMSVTSENPLFPNPVLPKTSVPHFVIGI